MNQETHIDKPRERTANRTRESGKACPRPWEIEQYIYKEEPRDDQRSSHSDPRLELALQSHGQHPDSDFIPHDEESDHEALHPGFRYRHHVRPLC